MCARANRCKGARASRVGLLWRWSSTRLAEGSMECCTCRGYPSRWTLRHLWPKRRNPIVNAWLFQSFTLSAVYNLLVFHSHEPSWLCECDPGDGGGQAGQGGGDGEVDVERAGESTYRAAEVIFIPKFVSRISFPQWAWHDSIKPVLVLEHFRQSERKDYAVQVKSLNMCAGLGSHLK